MSARRAQGFTVIQVVATHWQACPADEEGQTAFFGRREVRVNPSFFRRLDDRIAAIAAHGLVPCITVLWTLRDGDPGKYLSEEDASAIARYIVARYDAYQPVWFLGGDGRYLADGTERWKRIGRAVFGGAHRRALTTLHPSGTSWILDEFKDEPWFDFLGYQSGHGVEKHLSWIVDGPPANDWRRDPQIPVVNLEPCYEGHYARPTARYYTPLEVRRALYASLLVSPTAGVTYGHHSIWSWSLEREVPMHHNGTGIAARWYEALETEGALTVSCLRALFESLRWWDLRPAPELVAQPPAGNDPERYILSAAAVDGSFAVLYAPVGGIIELANPEYSAATWFNPRTGARIPVGEVAGRRVQTPDHNDWVLLLKR